MEPEPPVFDWSPVESAPGPRTSGVRAAKKNWRQHLFWFLKLMYSTCDVMVGLQEEHQTAEITQGLRVGFSDSQAEKNMFRTGRADCLNVQQKQRARREKPPPHKAKKANKY